MNEMLSMLEVAELLGLDSRAKRPERLARQFIKEIEMRTGEVLTIKKGKRIFTTETLMRNAIPELFVEDKYKLETLRGFRQTLEAQATKISQLTKEVELLRSGLARIGSELHK